MRREDLDKLLRPYPEATPIPERFANALGVVLPAVRGLQREVFADSLLGIWNRRRAEPALLSQPKEQWRDGRSSSSHGFAGYRPGTVPFTVDMLVSNPMFLKRLTAAALDTGARRKWDTFD